VRGLGGRSSYILKAMAVACWDFGPRICWSSAQVAGGVRIDGVVRELASASGDEACSACEECRNFHRQRGLPAGAHWLQPGTRIRAPQIAHPTADLGRSRPALLISSLITNSMHFIGQLALPRGTPWFQGLLPRRSRPIEYQRLR
jgi:hypothetical protein